MAYKKQAAALKNALPKPKSHLTLRMEVLPEIKDWKVGEEYGIELKVKMTDASSYADDDGNGKPEYMAGFEVIKAEADSEEEDKD
jgi:hypothetical protein